MDEKFRLVFRGELLEGQHRAVVKRRLAERLKLDDAQVEKLFSGKPVVVKRDADQQTAARYQSVFRQAGGLLQVEATGTTSAPAVAAAPATSVRDDPAADPGAGRASAVGSAASDDAQSPAFTVQNSYFPPPSEPAPEIHAPNYVVAEVGSLLVDPVEVPRAQVAQVDFELAEVGANLLDEPGEVVAVELGPLDFEVAEVGADLGPGSKPVTATAPDVSHLALVEASAEPQPTD